jgi:hypothetical protein
VTFSTAWHRMTFTILFPVWPLPQLDTEWPLQSCFLCDLGHSLTQNDIYNLVFCVTSTTAWHRMTFTIVFPVWPRPQLDTEWPLQLCYPCDLDHSFTQNDFYNRVSCVTSTTASQRMTFTILFPVWPRPQLDTEWPLQSCFLCDLFHSLTQNDLYNLVSCVTSITAWHRMTFTTVFPVWPRPQLDTEGPLKSCFLCDLDHSLTQNGLYNLVSCVTSTTAWHKMTFTILFPVWPRPQLDREWPLQSCFLCDLDHSLTQNKLYNLVSFVTFSTAWHRMTFTILFPVWPRPESFSCTWTLPKLGLHLFSSKGTRSQSFYGYITLTSNFLLFISSSQPVSL